MCRIVLRRGIHSQRLQSPDCNHKSCCCALRVLLMHYRAHVLKPQTFDLIRGPSSQSVPELQLCISVHVHYSHYTDRMDLPTAQAYLRLLFDNMSHDEEQNLATVLGFLLGLQQVLRVRRKGLVWLGLPCGSFGFISSSLHKRCQEVPMGDTTRCFVRTGNLLSSRGIMLAILGMVRGTFYFVEHPGQTMLGAFPYMRFMLALEQMNCRMMRGLTTRWFSACKYVCNQNGVMHRGAGYVNLFL